MSATVEKPTEAVDLSPVEAARKKVDEAHADELLIDRRIERLTAEMPDLKAAAGASLRQAMKDGKDGREAIGRLRDAEAEIEALKAALADARRERYDAIQSLYDARADEALAEAQAKRQASEEQAAKEQALLDQLKEVSGGAAYMPVARFHSVVISLGVNVAEPGARWPLSRRLREEAKDLERQAQSRRATEVEADGGLGRSDFGEMLEELASDAMKIGPSLGALRQWYESQPAIIEHRRNRGKDPEKGAFEFVVRWRRGELVEDQCLVKPIVKATGSKH